MCCLTEILSVWEGLLFVLTCPILPFISAVTFSFPSWTREARPIHRPPSMSHHPLLLSLLICLGPLTFRFSLANFTCLYVRRETLFCFPRYKYSFSSFSAGDTFQDAAWVPEINDSSKPYMLVIVPHLYVYLCVLIHTYIHI